MDENTMNQQTQQDTTTSTDSTFESAEAIPNMQDAQYNPNMQGAQYSPNMQGAQFDPNMQGTQYNPNMQGAQYNSNTQGSQYNYQQYKPIPEYDHTNKYEAEDISQNKSIAMLCYLLGPLGIIMAALLSQKSEFAMFHVRQATRFLVLDMLCTTISLLLFWTFIVPFLLGLLAVVLFIVKIITVVQIAQGKAVIPFILRSIKFL